MRIWLGHYWIVSKNIVRIWAHLALLDLEEDWFASFNCEQCGMQKFRRDALKIHNIMKIIKICLKQCPQFWVTKL